MVTLQKQLKSECWCYAIKRTVNIKGVILEKRQADLLKIKHCELENHCAFLGDADCLVGKIREGRW